jgi:predicted alpha/beta-fold hydrolase
MPDGGVVALDSENLPPSERLPADAPVLILLPGLTGGSEDSYVQHAVVHARAAGIRAVVFNSRGTSESPLTTAQFYSASFTEDLRCVVRHVASGVEGNVPIFAAGWSLGANILTRYLGEEGDGTPLAAAVAMCNPFDLPRADANFQRGFCKFYDWNLANSLRRIYGRHHDKFVEAAAAGERREFLFNLEA